MMNTLLVGCGKMGGALLVQWVRSEEAVFTVVDPMVEAVPGGATLVRERSELSDARFDLIIVAVKPQLIDQVMPAYQAHLAPGGFVASIAAGYSAGRLAETLGAPNIVRIMPNLPSQIGCGVSGLYAAPDLAEPHRKQIDALMRLAGRVVWVDTEDALDRVTAIAGSGPGYVFEIARCFVEAAKGLGFSEAESRDLVLQTMLGTLEMAMRSEESLETLRNNVTSKNGTTEAGLAPLREDDRLEKLFQAVTEAAYQRAIELR